MLSRVESKLVDSTLILIHLWKESFMIMKRRKVELSILVALITALPLLGLILNACQPAENPVVFKGKDTLLRPTGYREWVFVGSSLGLRYNQDFAENTATIYHNVYINLSAFRAFAKTGQFPDGTVMILELASAEEKTEPGLQGSFEKEFVGLKVSVKDSQRFDDVWAYFDFDRAAREGHPNEAMPEPKANCWSCHDSNAATDNVFTQFYPVLRAVAP